MGRRRPAQVRAGLPPRPGSPRTVIDRLDAAAQRDINSLERSGPRLRPGEVAQSVRRWRQYVHGPLRDLAKARDHGCPCCDDTDARRVLELALTVLPRRSARQLRAVVEPLDEVLLARTVPDPHTPPNLPWWDRRC